MIVLILIQSVNRTNVALSRAKHGLYVMGNASNLRKNPTWNKILDEMEKMGQVGYGFPAICPRHPEQVKFITEPGQLPVVAPLGMYRSFGIDALLMPL